MPSAPFASSILPTARCPEISVIELPMHEGEDSAASIKNLWAGIRIWASAVYHPRNPEENPVYGIVSEHLESFLADWI
jgi:hypothetical protein